MCIRAISWALATKVGDQNAKLVLISLADNADAEQYQCWPSAGHIAERCEISERSVYRSVNYLKEHGFIKCEHRHWPNGGSRSPLYTLQVPADTGGLPHSHPPLPHSQTPLTELCQTGLPLLAVQEPSLEPSQRKNGDEISKEPVWISRESKEWKAWEVYYLKTKGVRPPATTSKNDYGWWFASVLPPTAR